jgi:hypothetical protein
MNEVPKFGHKIGDIGSDDPARRLPHENIVTPDGTQPQHIIDSQQAILEKFKAENRKLLSED